jgi:zinc transport system substrate-binding protein
MKNTKLIAFIVGVILIAVVSYVLKIDLFKTTSAPSQEKKIDVIASFYPLYFFAKQIGGDKANVSNITPAGAEPHDYELSTKDIARIEKAAVLILNGGGLEAWGDKVQNNLRNKNVVIVTVADGLITQEVEDKGAIIKDSHIWLDPVLAKKEAQRIAQAFMKADPGNAVTYKANRQNLENKFDMLDSAFRNGLKMCEQKNIVTSHAAFGYLASQYGLKQVAIAGFSPDYEPSPKELGEVVQFAKNNSVKYIFFETLVSPKLSETIAKEVGAKTIVFNPLEGLTPEEQSDGKDYFSVQQENLANLRIALNCK